jgi:hypothetical protein
VLSSHLTSRLAVCLYALTFAGLGLAKAFFWRHAVRGGLLAPDTGAEQAARISRRVWATPATALVVVVTSFLGLPYTFVGFTLIPVVALLLDRSARRAVVAS